MPPSLATTAHSPVTSRAGQSGWLLPAGLLFALLVLGRWAQQPAGEPAAAVRRPVALRAALPGAAHLPGTTPAAAL